MPDPRALLAEITTELSALEDEANLSWWDANVASSPSADARQAAADLALREFFDDSERYAQVRDALAAVRTGEDGTEVAEGDPSVLRQLEILHNRFLPNQMSGEMRRRLVDLETGIGSAYNRFRAVIDGRERSDNELVEILRTSTDQEARRRAWEASKQIGSVVEADVRELARLRNDVARGLGFRDHFELALATSEIDEDRLFATLGELELATEAAWARRKGALDARRAQEFGIDRAELRPWHYADPFFQELPLGPELALDELFADRDLEHMTDATFDALGLDLGGLIANADLYARPAKSQHAFCVHIDRSGDVRVLTNIEPNRYWMGTLLHEFGHAVYDDRVERDLPWLLREPPHALSTEAIALLFGRLTNDVRWLRDIAHLDPETAARLAPDIRRAKADSLLISLRWMLVMTHFERDFYADPERDLNARWWELVERFQSVAKPPGRDAPDWAAKIHVALAPVYYQNYIYGEMLASQLEATLESAPGGLLSAATGARLVESVFAPGAVSRWDHLIESSTGEALTPRHLVAQVTAV